MPSLAKRFSLLIFLKTAVALFLLLLFWTMFNVYLLKSDNFFGKNFFIARYLPIAFVAGDPILAGDYYARADLAAKVSANGLLDQTGKDALVEKLVDQKVAKKLLGERKISITSGEVQQYFDYLKRVTFAGLDFRALGISERRFKTAIVQPEYQDVRLQISFAGDELQNKASSDQAKYILKQLAAGVAFEDLARQYSAESQSAQLGGDSGFVGVNDIVPEIYNQLSGYGDKKPHVIVSRFGLHIVIIKSKDSKGPNKSERYHLQQIYLKTTDFQKWFANQKKNFTIIKVL